MSTSFTIGPAASTGTSGAFYQGKLTLTQTPNTAENKSSIYWEFRIWANTSQQSPSNYRFQNGNQVTVVIDGNTVFSSSNVGLVALSGTSASNTVKLASGTVIVQHNTDGTKRLVASARYYQPNAPALDTINPSGTVTLTPIIRAGVISSAPDMTLAGSGTTNHTVQWTTVSGYYYKVEYKYGNTTLHTSNGLATDVTSYTWAVPASVAASVTDAKSMQLTVVLHTYSDSGYTAEVGTSSVKFTATFQESSFKPQGSGSTIIPHDGLSGVIVAGMTYFDAACLYSLVQGAEFVSAYAVYIDTSGNEISPRKYSNTSASIALDPIPSFTDTTKNLKVKVGITDTRGFTSEFSSNTFTAHGWVPPSITDIMAVRCNSDGTENLSGACYKLSVTYSIRSLNNANAKNAKVSYKYITDAAYTQSASGAVADYSTTLALGPYVLSPAQDEQLQVRVEISDSLSVSNPAVVTVTILPGTWFSGIMLDGDKKIAIGLGRRPTKQYTVQFGWTPEVRDEKDLEFYDQNGSMTGKVLHNSYGVLFAVVPFSDFSSSNRLDVTTLFGVDIRAVVNVTQRGGTGTQYYFWTNDGTPGHFYITLMRADGGTISGTTEFEITAIPY